MPGSDRFGQAITVLNPPCADVEQKRKVLHPNLLHNS